MYNSRKNHEVTDKEYLLEKLNEFNTQQKKKKLESAKKKVSISEQSNKKIMTVDQIDAYLIRNKSL